MVGIRNIYLHYRYKWYDVNSKTVPVPYFPKDQISEHEYKLKCTDWNNVLRIYFKEVIEELIAGKIVYMGKLGALILLKRKSIAKENKHKIKQEYHKSETKEVVKYYYTNLHTGGYSPYIKWIRNQRSGCLLKHKEYYKFNFLDTVWEVVSKRFHKEPHLINNLKDYDAFMAAYKDSSKQGSK